MLKQLLSFCLAIMACGALAAQSATTGIYEVSLPYTDAHAYFHASYEQLGLDDPHDLQLYRSFEWSNIRHDRYDQYYKGHQVIGSSFILHWKDDVLRKTSGALVKDLDLAVTPKISQSDAISRSEDFLLQLFKKKDLEHQDRYAGVRASSETSRLVIIGNNYPNPSTSYKLAYETIVSLNTVIPVREKVYVDAQNGQAITTLSMVSHSSVEGVANTKYYGEQTIIADSVGKEQFRLFDEERNVHTVDHSESSGFWDENFIEFIDKDNYWDNRNSYGDEIAGDAHYCSSAMHDFMMDRFNWKGPDGLGLEYKAYVHLGGGQSIVNAFWTGVASYYGDGDCSGYGPLTTLEVVGHEFAHGFTQYTSGLIYSSESGGMNEATSDIFGKALEYAYDPDGFDWYIGESFLENDQVTPFRSMFDPNMFGNPKYYGGLNWENSGVHSWSGLWNHWFYLLSTGGSGVNEGGYSFDVDSIGIEDALEIVFLMHIGYLTPSSTYHQARDLSELAVEDLFGANSTEWDAVNEAWKAIGVLEGGGGDTSTGGDFLDLAIYFNWNALEQCNDGAFQVPFRIQNNGRELVPQGTEIIATAQVDDGEVMRDTFTMPYDLSPFFVADFLFEEEAPIENNFVNVDLSLEFEDDNEYNNTSFQSVFFNDNLPDFNVALNSFLQDLSDGGACGGEFNALLSISFFNQGCDPILAGTVMPLDFEVNGSFTDIEVVIPFDVIGGQAFTHSEFLNGGDYETGTNNYSLTLDLADDNPNDNFNQGVFIIPDNWDGLEILDFEDQDPSGGGVLNITNDFNVLFDVIAHDGGYALGVRGSDNFATPFCSEPFDVFKEFGGGTMISMCVDATGLVEPELHLDLTMYDEDFGATGQQTEEISCMFRAFLPKSTGIEFPVELGLAEGESKHLAYTIPPNYVGEISFELATFRGNSFIDRENPDFDFGDHVILDNIEIRSLTTSTSETLGDRLDVYPNPADKQVRFAAQGSDELRVRIFGAAGQLVHDSGQFVGQYDLQTSDLATGLYIYEVISADKEKHSGKIMIQH